MTIFNDTLLAIGRHQMPQASLCTGTCLVIPLPTLFKDLFTVSFLACNAIQYNAMQCNTIFFI